MLGCSLPFGFNSEGPGPISALPPTSLAHAESKGPSHSAPGCCLIRVTYLQEVLLFEIMLHFLKLEHVLKLFKCFKKAKEFSYLRRLLTKYSGSPTR